MKPAYRGNLIKQINQEINQLSDVNEQDNSRDRLRLTCSPAGQGWRGPHNPIKAMERRGFEYVIYILLCRYVYVCTLSSVLPYLRMVCMSTFVYMGMALHFEYSYTIAFVSKRDVSNIHCRRTTRNSRVPRLRNDFTGKLRPIGFVLVFRSCTFITVKY